MISFHILSLLSLKLNKFKLRKANFLTEQNQNIKWNQRRGAILLSMWPLTNQHILFKYYFEYNFTIFLFCSFCDSSTLSRGTNYIGMYKREGPGPLKTKTEQKQIVILLGFCSSWPLSISLPTSTGPFCMVVGGNICLLANLEGWGNIYYIVKYVRLF